jgi:hypothetical protein
MGVLYQGLAVFKLCEHKLTHELGVSVLVIKLIGLETGSYSYLYSFIQYSRDPPKWT